MADNAGDGMEGTDVLYIWKIPIDRAYVKSLVGVLKIVVAIISLIAFICCASGRSIHCDHAYSSTYNFFEFVSISCFLTIVALWFFFVLTADKRVFFKVVPWRLVELIYLAVYALFYLIGFIVIAAQACGKDSNKAAAAFGFFALAGICAHGYFTFKEWREGRTQAATTTTNTSAPQYDPERNMDTY
ncbi:CKLF-like MARVEL transmembrane domain-containing protein 4 isoform X2 [Littorina saxatilis]|uniref:MARVEL domain-containing protein n=1 Tax=Littorina saxatilis TaxID=31220 RepID=A0AAN9BYX3_9CAEN